MGYKDGAVWELGGSRVRAFHAPGHTAGHCVLLVEPEGVAFIGDIDLSGFGPYYGDASSSLGDFRQTLARVADIPAKVWVTSHHRGVYTDREHFARDLAAYTADAVGVLESPDLDLVRIRLDLAYDGTDFSGWAIQPGRRTVCGEITDVLSTVLRREVVLVVAGRTDAGVHASGQVAHLDLPAELWAGTPIEK